MTVETEEKINRLIREGQLTEAARLAYDNGVSAVIHAVQQAYGEGYGDYRDWHSQ